jgi:hypothetical protein
MAQPCIQAAEGVRITGSGAVPVNGDGYLQGLIVNASASGTLTLVDGKSRTLLNALPLTAGQSVILYGIRYIGGLTATVGGTADVTLAFAN